MFDMSDTMMRPKKKNMYSKYVKRAIDFSLSLLALIILSPFLLVLTFVGAVVMDGNPFFIQARPGRNEKIFYLIKFRTMSNRKDANGDLLPDEQRLNSYGKALRSTSIDELPELLNIIKGDMSIVGPRPLLVSYLPYYTNEERVRHSVRPGLTGLAQIEGRNYLSWNERFLADIHYVNQMSFCLDVKIVLRTAKKVLLRNDVAVVANACIQDLDAERKDK